MTSIQPGTLLISSLTLTDTHFEQAVIVIIEHNEKGSSGFIINKLFARSLQDLQEFAGVRPFSLYAGGPVETEGIFFLHQQPGIIEGGKHLFDNIYLGGNFAKAVSYINNNSSAEKELKLFIGYCGWDAHQLEDEITEGSFMIVTEPVDIFSKDTATLWENLYKKNRQ